MKKITLKIIFLVVIVFLVSTIIPRFVIRLTGEFPERDLIISDVFFIGVLISVGLALVIFTIMMNHVIVKRIKKLNEATEKVTQGDFDVNVEARGSDEISSLIKHFNVMTKELKSNEYLSKSFVRNVSHEMRTPLAAIKGYADLLLQDELSKDEIIEYASIISDTAQSLGILSHNILEISKLESSNIIQTNQPFNLSEQIRNVIQFMQLQWENKNVELDLDLDEIMIESNKPLLYQVWKNLFENATKYTPENQKIKWVLKENNQYIYVTLTNYGVGVTPEDLDQLFNLFYTAEHTSSHGFGVGLSIVKKIIDKLNGEIKISSEENKYFSVDVTLPKTLK